MILSASLTCLIALIFALLGAAKILALGPMPELAAHAGFTPAAYRLIGALELAGAIGVATGPVLPLLGELAGLGLLLLLAGAVTTHVRKGDGSPKLVPAVACSALVAWYLVLLAGGGS
ncbi:MULTISPECIES: DoxX family protein [unclassified Streptomyces]|uniref:DoxX family protein n=1 Tax=unclassified Streptomyces TaxID=2593676 RepID=UPI00119DB628|nr:DoxX family protein [Streptomyces sp. BK340]TVZ92447.1 DoxX-like protein [Streptomyces sp. BK340]